MTITIDGVDTVIRKDNCKVQAFGDVVRITDYKGSIYEFLYSDCTSPSEANANDLRDAIEEFLNTGGGGSSDYLSYVALLTQSGTSAPTATVLQNNTGLTWTFDYVDVGDYDAVPSIAPSDDNKVLVFGGDGTGDITKMRWRSGSAKIETKNSSFASDNGRLSNTPIEIRIYP